MRNDLARFIALTNAAHKVRDMQHRNKLRQTPDENLKHRITKVKPYSPLKPSDVPLEVLVKLPVTHELRRMAKGDTIKPKINYRCRS